VSLKFDKSEVPQFHAEPLADQDKENAVACIACGDTNWIYQLDRDTGLCRACWRIVVLGPAMENRK
jgi:hypothetical protein